MGFSERYQIGFAVDPPSRMPEQQLSRRGLVRDDTVLKEGRLCTNRRSSEIDSTHYEKHNRINSHFCLVTTQPTSSRFEGLLTIATSNDPRFRSQSAAGSPSILRRETTRSIGSLGRRLNIAEHQSKGLRKVRFRESLSSMKTDHSRHSRVCTLDDALIKGRVLVMRERFSCSALLLSSSFPTTIPLAYLGLRSDSSDTHSPFAKPLPCLRTNRTSRIDFHETYTTDHPEEAKETFTIAPVAALAHSCHPAHL
jgi:hypothetical protein